MPRRWEKWRPSFRSRTSLLPSLAPKSCSSAPRCSRWLACCATSQCSRSSRVLFKRFCASGLVRRTSSKRSISPAIWAPYSGACALAGRSGSSQRRHSLDNVLGVDIGDAEAHGHVPRRKRKRDRVDVMHPMVAAWATAWIFADNGATGSRERVFSPAKKARRRCAGFACSLKEAYGAIHERACRRRRG